MEFNMMIFSSHNFLSASIHRALFFVFVVEKIFFLCKKCWVGPKRETSFFATLKIHYYILSQQGNFFYLVKSADLIVSRQVSPELNVVKGGILQINCNTINNITITSIEPFHIFAKINHNLIINYLYYILSNVMI